MISNPKDSVAKHTLESLPNEVLDNISQVLVGTSADGAKSLRLVSRRFADVTVKHIFGTLLLRQHPEKWENLNKIAQVPALAAVVRTIQVAQVPVPIESKSREDGARLQRIS